MTFKNVLIIILGYSLLLLLSCNQSTKNEIVANSIDPMQTSGVQLLVLGNVQDAGSPHIACKKDCCKDLFGNPDPNRKVVSLGLINYNTQKTYLFEASPDMPEQLKKLKQYLPDREEETPDGIFLTHAHIGHYTGLMYLGKEAMNAQAQAVYVMPDMKYFLENNGPWEQLVTTNNIMINELQNRREVVLSNDITVIPFKVPHRDEYSETVGFQIIGPNKSALFIPDIDKWEKWDEDISAEIAKVDIAFIDATFYDAEEINHRDISEIPHPFVIESMALFAQLPDVEKNKIHFIHLNHTNPLLNSDSKQSKLVEARGYHVARFGDVFSL